jgi:hypothetical protein
VSAAAKGSFEFTLSSILDSALQPRISGRTLVFAEFLLPFVSFVATASSRSATLDVERHGATDHDKGSLARRSKKSDPRIPELAVLHAAATNEASRHGALRYYKQRIDSQFNLPAWFFFLDEARNTKNVLNKAVNPLKTNDLIIKNRLKAVRL